MWTIFQSLFVTILLLFCVLVFWPRGMWNLSSLTRGRSCTPCIGRWSVNYWTSREVPKITFIYNRPWYQITTGTNGSVLTRLKYKRLYHWDPTGLLNNPTEQANRFRYLKRNLVPSSPLSFLRQQVTQNLWPRRTLGLSKATASNW